MFDELPKRRDQAFWKELHGDFPEEMSAVDRALLERIEEFGENSESWTKLAVNLLENARAMIPIENTIAESSLAQNRAIKKLLDKINQTSKEENIPKYRKRLIKQMLKIYDHGEYTEEIEGILDLGAPFNLQNSIEMHRQLAKHEAKQWRRLNITAFIDQAVWVGISGGIIFRAITAWAVGG